jgi:hypothetical protein
VPVDLNNKTKQLNRRPDFNSSVLFKINQAQHYVFHYFSFLVADLPLSPPPLSAMSLPPFDLLDQAYLTEMMLEATQNALHDVFRIGEFLVGDGDASNLGGHPDIRY